MHAQRARVTQAFRALGDDTRIAIIRTLAARRCESVEDIVEAVQLPRSTVSHALQLLHRAGLVDYEAYPGGQGLGARHEYFIVGDVLSEALTTMNGLVQGAKNDETVKIS